MRVLNLAGRLQVSVGERWADVEVASAGQFPSDPHTVFDRWADFTRWADTLGGDISRVPGVLEAPLDASRVEAPSPRPRQVFAVGLNYQEHADESGFVRPKEPLIFTKFASSITGPTTVVELPVGDVDWEVELVVVIGEGGRNIPIDQGWRHVAGLTVGQDLSERQRQHAGPAPQFGLAKSHQGFSPTGPVLVTPDELDDPDDLELGAAIDGQSVQQGRTSQMIFSVPELVQSLSQVVELYPGDLIFTGTPSGVGAGRTPPRFLQAGEVLRSHITGIGHLEQTFTDAATGNGFASAPALTGHGARR